jgi:hypothetical protein
MALKIPSNCKAIWSNIINYLQQFDALPVAEKFEQKEGNNQVYVVDHDMKQTEIIVLEKGGKYDIKSCPCGFHV